MLPSLLSTPDSARPQAHLDVVTYHYIRDLPNTPFPRIKGLLTADFHRQLRALVEAYEMATLESAFAFLIGAYHPRRHLCLLTFDDGLREHYTDVTPLLADLHVQGVFFLITSCMDERRTAPVHMNHFLLATMTFEDYRTRFVEQVQELSPGADGLAHIDPEVARRTYPWDDIEVARFKRYFNFELDPGLRDRAVGNLFETYVGGASEFAQQLYLNWTEAREMQNAGMVLGGHTHRHRPLSALPAAELRDDLNRCVTLMESNVHPQPLWPFSYPYGRRDSYNDESVAELRRAGYHCGFSTEVGGNYPGADVFSVRRFDTKQVPGGPLLQHVTQS
ncbi:MAG: polysaccharide deacetylase family protein [Bryobacterales bacterium]|nr:polysaccharide deacetylase family protein [Bryobacterales bacterium]